MGYELKIGAYVLAADPTWIQKSVIAYYDFVDVLVVSSDVHSRSWTGTQIPATQCVRKIRDIDERSIVVQISNDYSTIAGSPMQRDTKQRQDCIDYLSKHVDWIIQIDTDEWIPDVRRLLSVVSSLPETIDGVEWPMRVLYRQLNSNLYLAITDAKSNPVYEYPGPILVRKNVTLIDARRISSSIVRYSVSGDTSSLQLNVGHTKGINVRADLQSRDAVVHNSWARSPKSVWRKVLSWSHHDGLKSLLYFLFIWLPAPILWRYLRDFHPFAKGLWPRLGMLEIESSSN
jgi:hypothetical protein